MRTELSASHCFTTRWAGTIQTIATSPVDKALLPGRASHDKPVTLHNGLMDMCMCVCVCADLALKTDYLLLLRVKVLYFVARRVEQHILCEVNYLRGTTIISHLFCAQLHYFFPVSFVRTHSSASSPCLPYSPLMCACQQQYQCVLEKTLPLVSVRACVCVYVFVCAQMRQSRWMELKSIPLRQT